MAFGTPFKAISAMIVLLSLATMVTAKLNQEQLDDALRTCPIVQQLDKQKELAFEDSSSLTKQIFAVLFPGSPAVNALLATLYISGPPNFLLALCPPDIDPASLTIMVAFAAGGLIGDTVLHLLPEIFLGEDPPHHTRLVAVDNNKNLVLALGIIVGFVTFMAMEKSIKIAMGQSHEGHAHTHSHAPRALSPEAKKSPNATSTAIEDESKQLRTRKVVKTESQIKTTLAEPAPPVKLSAYLNLISDFIHNITDGLALSSSFYASPALGATTTAAVFFHEIPHEVGDFALLIQGGFSKKKAMAAQFVTAVGAFLGTCLGIFIQEFGGNSASEKDVVQPGLLDTGLTWGDMLLPFTAGTFLYVGTVAVIPELLETGPNKTEELWKTAKQFVAMAAGVGIMLAISWS